MKLTLGTLFSGIKAPEKALTNLGIDFESKFTSEWDIYATVGGNEIHNNNQKINYPTEDEMRKHLLRFTWSSDGKKPCGEDYIKRMKGNKLKGLYKAQIQSNNLGSILDINIDKLPHVDMLAWGSPCQDFSVAGNGKGSTWTCEECNHEYNPLFVDYQKRDMCPKCNSDNIEHTRSSLIIKGLETVRKVQPKVSIFENVEGLTYKNHKDGFEAFLKELESYGYKNFHKVVNAKHWGIPQKRKRIFVISFREDVDCSSFEFPVSIFEDLSESEKDKAVNLPKVILEDILEDEVDEKYYLSEEKIENFKIDKKNNVIGNLNFSSYQQENKVYDVKEVAPTLTSGGANSKIKILETYSLKRVRTEEGKRLRKENRKKTGKDSSPFSERKLIVEKAETSNCITASLSKDHLMLEKISIEEDEFHRIRKLTPLECWRLMGFKDEDYYKVKKTILKAFYNGNDRSDSRMVKMAGNSIVTVVLSALFNEIIKTLQKSSDVNERNSL